MSTACVTSPYTCSRGAQPYNSFHPQAALSIQFHKTVTAHLCITSSSTHISSRLVHASVDQCGLSYRSLH